MIPISASDLIRFVAAEARSTPPTAPDRLEAEARPTSARFARVRVGLGAALRRLANRVVPCRSAVPAPVRVRRG